MVFYYYYFYYFLNPDDKSILVDGLFRQFHRLRGLKYQTSYPGAFGPHGFLTSILSPSRDSQLITHQPLDSLHIELSIIVNLAILSQQVDGSELRKTALPYHLKTLIVGKARVWRRD